MSFSSYLWLLQISVIILLLYFIYQQQQEKKKIATTSVDASTQPPGYYTAGTIADRVFVLDRHNFDTALHDPVNPFWLFKFYAPWCGHCKKMAPILDRIAPQLMNQMAIGKIDCTIEQTLCNQYHIKGYPTMKYSIDGGALQDYMGGRTEQEIIAFSRHMLRPDVTLISSMEELNNYIMEKTGEGVVFLAFHPEVIKPDDDTTTKLEERLRSTSLTQSYYTASRRLKASSHFLLVENHHEDIDEMLSSLGRTTNKEEPFICRYEPGIPLRCMTNNDTNTISVDDIIEYVTIQNVPTVAILGPSNLHRLGRKGRKLVIGLIDSHDNVVDLHKIQTLFTNHALQHDTYYYGTLDGTSWSHFLQQFDISVSQLPQFMILDLPKKQYWYHAMYGLDLTSFIKAVENGNELPQIIGKSKNRGWDTILFDMFVDYLPYSAVIVGALAVAMILLITFYCIPRDDDDYYDHIEPPQQQHPPTSTTTSSKDDDNQDQSSMPAPSSIESKKDQ